MNSMKNKKLIVRIILTTLLVILAIIVSKQIVDNSQKIIYSIEKNGIVNKTVVGEILTGTEIRQEIYVEDTFCGAEILFANYANDRVNSDYNIKIVTEDDEVIYNDDVNAKEFSDNTYYSIILDDEYEAKDEIVEVIITSYNAVNNNALTIWMSDDADGYSQGQLFINGQEAEGDLVFNTIIDAEVKDNSGVIFYRLLFFAFLVVFLLLNIWIDIKKLYDFIYKYRVAIAFVVFIFMVANKINYSSIGMFDSYIQKGSGSQYVEPIWGEPRAIRSDEWLVGTPRKLTIAYEGITGTNGIPMALEVNNITASGVQLGWGLLGTPMLWGYLTGDVEIGLSFKWNAAIICMLMFSFEFCMILSKKNKLLSLLGAVLITYSSFCLWWSFDANWLLYSQAAIVCFYYAINSEAKWKKLAYGIGTALAGSGFVTTLYPAWQVPSAYVVLIVLIWIIVSNWARIKTFDKKDWTIIIGCIAFMVSIIAAYLISNMEYVNSITNTVYPGARVSNGGYSLKKLSNYIGAWMFGYRGIGNPSEAGTVFNLYPLPILMAIVYMIKKKKWDGLTGSLTIYSLFLTLYCTCGIPMILSKLTLMSNTTEVRAVDILSVVQLYLFIAVAGRIAESGLFKRYVAYGLVFVIVLAAAYQFNIDLPTYYNKYELIFITAVITVCIAPWLIKSKKVERVISTVVLCSVTFAFAIMVHPVMKGLDVLYSKPVAQEISNIVEKDQDAKWLSIDSIISSGYLISCGAPTINSTNYIPNYDLWEILDEEGTYEECYNRYAHMVVALTEDDTSVQLIHADHIFVNLSYDDLEKIDVKYIYSNAGISGTEDVVLKEIYKEQDSYIYEVIYK